MRGLTKLDTSIPEEERGTYRGAARKADYLKQLGVTAVEFLPVHESENDGNDIPGTKDINYWGYSTLDFFAPDRRYAADKTPGGPTREFKAMIKAFHDAGIKVYLDVVYNHTGEGSVIGGQPDTIAILSWRGLDNRTYYELTEDNRFYYDNTGVNGNFNAANTTVRNLILDSLRYWSRTMGVDGFRFDLAPILGNKLDHQRPGDHQGFIFDATAACNPLNQALRELPVRPPDGGPGVDLIAEPWLASGDDTQEQGRLPRRLGRMERPLPRRLPHVAKRARAAGRHPRRVCDPVRRLERPLSEEQPQAVALDQLYCCARRLLPARPLLVHQPRSEGVGPGRRYSPPTTGDSQRLRLSPALGGRAHVHGGRRDVPHPERKFQCL